MPYFFQDSNLVPTDIAAGLLLVQEKQEQEELAQRKAKELRAKINSEKGDAKHVLVTCVESAENVTINEVKDFEDICPVMDTPSVSVSLKDWMHLDNIKYYLRFAMAMYGWPLHMVTNLSCGICQLAPYCR